MRPRHLFPGVAVAVVVLAGLVSAAPSARSQPFAPEPACSDAQVNAAVAKKVNCGAVVSGPASLRLGPCPNSPVGTAPYPTLCTGVFTLSLTVTGGRACTTAKALFDATCVQPNDVKLTAGAVGDYGVRVSSGQWCAIGSTNCTSGRSEPQRIFVPKGSSARKVRFSVFGHVTKNPGPVYFATLTIGIGSGPAPQPVTKRPTAIDWEMPKRFTVADLADRGANFGTPTVAQVNPKEWTAEIFTTSKNGPFDCGSDVRFVWTVKQTDRLVGGKQPKVACRSKLHVTRLGTYALSAQMQRRSGGAWRDSGAAIPGKVDVRDWLIVGMGDSNGSGEGNAPFYYLRCNRSEKSYQVQTALAVENKDPHSSVTFIHTSCSGARVEHLMTVGYAGTRPAATLLPPQIDEVNGLLEVGGTGLPRRDVDVALVSAGVNDLAFGPVLEYCVVHAGLGEKRLTKPSTWVAPSEESITANPCQNRKVVALPEKVGTRIGSFVDDPTPDALSKTLASYVAKEQGRVANERFDTLPAALKKLGVRRDRVFLAQYPDFSHDEQGQTCSFSGIARLPSSTWAWLGVQADLLNANIQKAAKPNGWPVPQWRFDAFKKRGYCAKPSFIRAIVNANLSPFLTTKFLAGYPVLAVPYADAAGPFHPTAEGHKIEADGTIPVVCRKLYEGDATCNASRTTP